ncbi:Scr1 family TA system antitoxin-like transcriptional regulator [Streptomyces sp. NPDC093097]|uniref:Scr1 family TA system antitoxin-like transcriptional regulator n=1 Tax=Streptomyces sp. NPDC093097 TaxID=3366027 RepID=UPI00380A79DD
MVDHSSWPQPPSWRSATGVNCPERGDDARLQSRTVATGSVRDVNVPHPTKVWAPTGNQRPSSGTALTSVIPGLLQTKGYARALMRAGDRPPSRQSSLPP